MDEKQNANISRDYVFGQGINYFLLSMLVMLAAAKISADPGLGKPFFYWDTSGPIPLPILNIHFNLAYWLILALSLILLCLSIYFLVVLFHEKSIPRAARLSSQFSGFLGPLVVISFAISWLSALPPLLSEMHDGLIAAIFIYSGFVLFILAFIHSIRASNEFYKVNSSR